MSFRCISVISRNPEQQWKLGRKELHNLQLRRLNSHAAVVSKAAPSKQIMLCPLLLSVQQMEPQGLLKRRSCGAPSLVTSTLQPPLDKLSGPPGTRESAIQNQRQNRPGSMQMHPGVQPQLANYCFWASKLRPLVWHILALHCLRFERPRAAQPHITFELEVLRCGQRDAHLKDCSAAGNLESSRGPGNGSSESPPAGNPCEWDEVPAVAALEAVLYACRLKPCLASQLQ